MYASMTFLIAATIVLGPMTAPASAQSQYGQGTNTECVETQNSSNQDSTTYAPGAEIIVSGKTNTTARRCADPNVTVEVRFESDPVVLGRLNSNARGEYDSTPLGMRIPSDAQAGSHIIRVVSTLNGRTVTYSRGITVTGSSASSGSTPGGLPTTGRDIALFTMWGLILVGFGTFLFTASRRYNTPAVAVGTPPAPDREERYPDWGDLDLRPASTISMPLGRVREADVPPLLQPKPSEPPVAAPVAREAPAGTEAVDRVVQRASSQTSELVSKLQDEIKAWAQR